MTKRPTSASPASSRARGRSSTATKASTRSVGSRCSAAHRALCSSIQARISTGRCGAPGGPCSGVHASRRKPLVASARETAARVPGARRQSLERIRRAPVRSTMERRLSRSSGSNARGLGGGGGRVSRPSSSHVAKTNRRRDTVHCVDPRRRDVPSGHQHPVHVEEEHFHRVSKPREEMSCANDPIENVASRSRPTRGEAAASPASRARSCVFRDEKVHKMHLFDVGGDVPTAAGGTARVRARGERTKLHERGRDVRSERARRAREGVSPRRAPRYSLSGRARPTRGKISATGAMDRPPARARRFDRQKSVSRFSARGRLLARVAGNGAHGVLGAMSLRRLVPRVGGEQV